MQRVQQAWSYDWAAGQAEAESRHEESARLARRAGVCWEKTQLPHRLSRAATCYYRAAVEASQSAQLSTRRKIFESWCPSCLRDLTRTQQCLEHESSTSPEDIAASDVERIVRCWRTLRDERGMPESDDLFEEQDRELSGIQRRLAAVGERGEAKRL